jgi:hypothetical protein
VPKQKRIDQIPIFALASVDSAIEFELGGMSAAMRL